MRIGHLVRVEVEQCRHGVVHRHRARAGKSCTRAVSSRRTGTRTACDGVEQSAHGFTRAIRDWVAVFVGLGAQVVSKVLDFGGTV
mgnify:CR=1 FL=1